MSMPRLKAVLHGHKHTRRSVSAPPTVAAAARSTEFALHSTQQALLHGYPVRTEFSTRNSRTRVRSSYVLLQRNKAESRAAAIAELQHRLKAELLEGKAGLSFPRYQRLARATMSSIYIPQPRRAVAVAGWLTRIPTSS